MEDHEISQSNYATLQRFLNGLFVSFDVDKLLPAFEPFHRGIAGTNGTVHLRFPGFPDRYELRLGSSAVVRRVTLAIDIRLPIHAPGFWFCIHGLMADDFVTLVAADRIYYANQGTPAHIPEFDYDTKQSLGSAMTRVQSVDELVRLFTDSDRVD